MNQFKVIVILAAMVSGVGFGWIFGSMFELKGTYFAAIVFGAVVFCVVVFAVIFDVFSNAFRWLKR